MIAPLLKLINHTQTLNKMPYIGKIYFDTLIEKYSFQVSDIFSYFKKGSKSETIITLLYTSPKPLSKATITKKLKGRDIKTYLNTLDTLVKVGIIGIETINETTHYYFDGGYYEDIKKAIKSLNL